MTDVSRNEPQSWCSVHRTSIYSSQTRHITPFHSRRFHKKNQTRHIVPFQSSRFHKSQTRHIPSFHISRIHNKVRQGTLLLSMAGDSTKRVRQGTLLLSTVVDSIKVRWGTLLLSIVVESTTKSDKAHCSFPQQEIAQNGQTKHKKCQFSAFDLLPWCWNRNLFTVTGSWWRIRAVVAAAAK